MQVVFVEQTSSTNALLHEMLQREQLPNGTVLCAAFQTAGRGQRGNVWESERGKNLIFSILLYPLALPAAESFFVAQAAALAVQQTLDTFLPSTAGEHFKVKWANDVYFDGKKIGGILVENIFSGAFVAHSIVGIGVNINQKIFSPALPNPVSLAQITGAEFELTPLLNGICSRFLFLMDNKNDRFALRRQYFEALYRREGFHAYQSPDGREFRARTVAVEEDGKLILEDESGSRHGFYFKELKFV